MGAVNIKETSIQAISEECKKEYFKVVKKDFSEGLKTIKSTIHKHSSSSSVSFSFNDNWINFLLEKFTEYLEKNSINSKSIEQVLNYLKNMDESCETKHIHNLEVYLTRENEVNLDSTKSKI